MTRPAKSKTGNGKGNVEWTRQHLTTAAARQFAVFGYDGASLSKIREEVGVNNSTIHYHFGSKQGLYNAVAEQIIVSLSNLVLTLSRHADLSPMKRFLLFIESVAQWGNDNQDYTTIILHEMMSKQLYSAKSPFYQSMNTVMHGFVTFLEGDDSREVWREIDWPVHAVTLLFTIWVGQAMSVASELVYQIDESAWKQRQLNSVIRTHLLSLSKSPNRAKEFLRQHRPSCFT